MLTEDILLQNGSGEDICFVGPRAVIYKITLDDLGIEIAPQETTYESHYEAVWENTQHITDIGFEWRIKNGSGQNAEWEEWNHVSCVDMEETDEDGNLTVKSFQKELVPDSDDGQVAYRSYFYQNGTVPCKRVMPIFVIVRRLPIHRQFEIRSYKTIDGICEYYNDIEGKLINPQGGVKCDGIVAIGATQEQWDTLRKSMDTMQTIFSGITTATTDFLRSFRAYIQPLEEGVCATSDMYFAPRASCLDLQTVVHEVTHKEVEGFTKLTTSKLPDIERFMNFLTHSKNGRWKWQGKHAYPFLCPTISHFVTQYFVAACCQVNREG
jgi:hypothetical protein